MTGRRRSGTGLGCLLVLAGFCFPRSSGWSQITTGAGSSSGSLDGGGRSVRRGVDDASDPMNAKLPESYAKLQNAERQRRLVLDTDRLLDLTNRLKETIATSGSETLTPDMLRQMDEIEKLARSVKNKMRN